METIMSHKHTKGVVPKKEIKHMEETLKCSEF